MVPDRVSVPEPLFVRSPVPETILDTVTSLPAVESVPSPAPRVIALLKVPVTVSPPPSRVSVPLPRLLFPETEREPLLTVVVPL